MQLLQKCLSKKIISGFDLYNISNKNLNKNKKQPSKMQPYESVFKLRNILTITYERFAFFWDNLDRRGSV